MFKLGCDQKKKLNDKGGVGHGGAKGQCEGW